MQINRRRLTIHILIGMCLGIVVGSVFNRIGTEGWVDQHVVKGALGAAGSIFLNLLKVLVIPLVFVSLVCGAAALDDIKKVGRVGLKTLALYLGTTAGAITLAIIAAIIVQPGAGFTPDPNVAYEVRPADSLWDTLVNMVPANIVESMADGQMLPVIVFAVLFGLALVVAGEAGQRVAAFFNDLNEVIMKLVFLVMLTAPYGVFALVTRTFAKEGFGAIAPLAKYFGLVILVLLLHGIVNYSLLLKFLSRLSPVQFFRNARAVHLFAFSTASSNATLPVSMEVAETRLGVKKSVSSFVLPLGATINMDGTAIMQGVATVFIAQAYQIPLNLGDYLMVIVTATLASIGTAGVPGVGLVMLAMVLKQVGLPEAGIGLIVGIDRLLDMVRTAVNVTGDLVVSTIVARSEGQLDEAVFHAPNPEERA